MENGTTDREEEDTRRLVVAIIDFLRDQLLVRTDLVPEDRDCLEIAIQCLEMAYGLEAHRFVQYRFARPLLDVFNQVTNPVSIRDKLRAEAHKDEGNSYMRRNMFTNAEAEYTQAIDLDRWNAIYFCNRASSRVEQQNYFEAINDCRQALMLNPDYAKAHARMGQAYALLHRPREAARCFRQASELEPANENYRTNMNVAESQIRRTGGLDFLAALISAILEPSRDPNDPTSTVNMPTSVMIITESHPPTREDPIGSAAENDEQAEIEQSDERDSTVRSTEVSPGIVSHSSTEAHPIVYPQPYGVVQEGSEEQSLPQIDVLRDLICEDGGEFVFHIPTTAQRPVTPVPPERDEVLEVEDAVQTEEGVAQPDLSTGAQVSASENESCQRNREEEQALNARIKVSREDLKEPITSDDISCCSTDPPIIPRYMTNRRTSTGTNENVILTHENETTAEISSDSVQPISNETNNETERKDGRDSVLHSTGEAEKLRQEVKPDFDNDTEVIENNLNADFKEQNQKPDENETANVPDTRNRKDNKEGRNDSEDLDDGDD